ncbi:MAG: hypothetical protein EBZ69_04340 [Alphaproteobacteria bacterium]|nr:hypothetical protein [Alphaproteobacteria bacterium]NDC56027.1 hypothetical protein [Alphaproteobacteria bacterium]NDG04189.1 hypothetical protein [Alphaproteobacteria bacterium]
MADKKAPAKGKDPKAAAGKGGGKQKKQSNPLTVLIMFGGILLAIFLPTACIVLPGLLPAMVAFVVDRDREKAAAITVFALNSAGVLPLVVDLVKKGHDFDAAFTILGNPASWMMMYGAAGMGWLLVFFIPPLVVSLMQASAESRIKEIADQQGHLRKTWGNAVAGESE